MYLEEYSVGMEREFGSKTVSKEEIIRFASEFDPQPFHLDEEAAKDSMFGELVASGWHTCSMLMRMLCDEFLLDDVGSLGSGGVDNIRWKKPVRPNDTLRVQSRVTEVRPSESKPDRGIVKSQYSVLNQDDQLVMTIESMGFFLKKPT
ncbi:MAG: MaoC family dehydratase [Alphaproteobacteria bacterium]|jgi:acyl dehydratase|nr:MaoC family dehydratase [Alphaproteobacteria bacterium]MBT4083220.1 MaoC family dehydratase [Alphaproteobacteria bacterium]MBT4544284.1 MaoC family dehydratase [Alphaproteobacteria bacterium]MBT7747803.1 MaoC family dehydratase [Alphaproteobacteria bacterium]